MVEWNISLYRAFTVFQGLGATNKNLELLHPASLFTGSEDAGLIVLDLVYPP